MSQSEAMEGHVLERGKGRGTSESEASEGLTQERGDICGRTLRDP